MHPWIRYAIIVIVVAIAGLGALVFSGRAPDGVTEALARLGAPMSARSGVAAGSGAAATPAPGANGEARGHSAGAPVVVETEQAVLAETQHMLTAIGTLIADETVTVSPQISGQIAEILFEDGTEVAAGAPLVRLDSTLLEAELEQARADLVLAEANYQRAETLRSRQSGTQQALDEARAALARAEAAVKLAETRLRHATVRAPFAGVLGLRSVGLGAYVSQGEALVTLQRIDPIRVEFHLPETALAVARVGGTVTLTLDALPGETHQGTISAIDPQVDVNGRSLRLRATVPNPQRRLKPGLFARVSLVASQQQAVTVAESALVREGEDVFVYVVREGRAVRTPVSIGQRTPGRVVIASGVAAGEEVVIAGQQRLRDGVRVTAAGEDEEPGAGNAPTAARPPSASGS